MTYKIGIIGASGFTGRELAGLLAHDEAAEIVFVTSRQSAGKSCAEAGRAYEALSTGEMVARRPDAVFFCTPHGVALASAPAFVAAGIRVIDLSADFRFADPAVFAATYGIPFADPGLPYVYGLPEWQASAIADARIIANPGCYVTGALAALMPVKALIEWAVIDGKSGYSGAGVEKAPELRQKLNENACAYTLTGHRHEPEIQQFIAAPVYFTPHLLPFFRGMEVTAHIKLKPEARDTDFAQLYRDVYRNAAEITVSEKIPEIADVQNTNRLQLGGFAVDAKGRLVVTAVLDNLRKGAASQAVENFHLAFGITAPVPEPGEIFRFD